ncbi:MAG: MBOAT family protein [Pedosphaera sp.]|nr:MBOAT family protein [Pedosphaera sp.]
MAFTSWSFAVFLPLVFVLHYAGRSLGWQLGILILASFVFYGWEHPWLVLLLAASTTINAEAARRLLHPNSSRTTRHRALVLALVANLGALAFFKYARLLGPLLLPASLLNRWDVSFRDIPLPVGISFYTFQGISLVVDAWRAGSAGIRGLPFPATPRDSVWFHARVWFFKAFFPQLIAGPIVKAGEFLHQISPKRLTDVDWDGASRHLITGFFLKLVVADNLREATASLASPLFLVLPKLNLIALLYGFSFRIYADFCGYSLIAMGLAKLFGYELPINFNLPYLSQSITEFWRRWHLSLSSWLREYLYVPLGGNRKGPTRTYINLFLVMFLGGLWHGVAWSYAVWGIAHGVLLAFERFFGGSRRNTASNETWTAGRILRAFLVFNGVSLLWLLFQLSDFRDVIAYIHCLFHNPWGAQPQALYVISLFSLPVIIQHLRGANFISRRLPARLEAPFFGFLLFLILVNSGTPGDFIYFQF